MVLAYKFQSSAVCWLNEGIPRVLPRIKRNLGPDPQQRIAFVKGCLPQGNESLLKSKNTTSSESMGNHLVFDSCVEISR